MIKSVSSPVIRFATPDKQKLRAGGDFAQSRGLLTEIPDTKSRQMKSTCFSRRDINFGISMFLKSCSVAVLMFAATPAYAQMPSLPAGLGGSTQSAEDVPPPLPDFGGDDENIYEEGSSSLPFDLTGFFEVRGGVRWNETPLEKEASLGEARLQLQAEKHWNTVSARVTTDLLYDPVAGRYGVDLQTGDGVIDLREAFVSWRATDFMDLKLGRQVLTWGTGDLLFLNDMFPKDYDSFFIGRDLEYLKAPSDALKTSFFTGLANLDVVYTPNFDADRYADGRRVSVYNPFAGTLTGTADPVRADMRSAWFGEDEWAARLYRNFSGTEAALYFYDGYWKNPQGQLPLEQRVWFPRLRVYGASLRGPVAAGIGNIELAWYDSLDDDGGDDLTITNDQIRILLGYEQELAHELTGGFQAYLEKTRHYDRHQRISPPGAPLPDENRQVYTVSLTKTLMNQNLTLSLFNFWSPTERDGYVRPKVHYKIDDRWNVEAGGNVFWGHKRHTFFGQLEDNTNVYAGVRYSF